MCKGFKQIFSNEYIYSVYMCVCIHYVYICNTHTHTHIQSISTQKYSTMGLETYLSTLSGGWNSDSSIHLT